MNELLIRRKAVIAKWFEFVAAAKKAGWTVEDLWTEGVILTGDGSLELRGTAADGSRQLVLFAEVGDDEVKVAFQSPAVEEMMG